jgi:GT2 family glycosyltransferase
VFRVARATVDKKSASARLPSTLETTMPGDDAPRTLSVVVPTFERPTWIKRAVASLARQTRAPDEVVVVMRDTDELTHRSVDELARSALPFPLRPTMVSAPGFLPPVEKGLSVASGDVIAVMDDDAEAQDGWAERILANYRDRTIGAVGGRCINMIGEEVEQVPDTDVVGRVTRVGTFVGNMYKRPTFSDPVDVDFMIGGCMSFRREVARRLEFDMELNHNVAHGYEVDLGLQVKALGLRIVFDPAIAIRHYSAPRKITGVRSFNDTEGVRWASYNHARVAMRRLPLARKAVALGYLIAIGNRSAPGLVPVSLGPIAGKMGFRVAMGPAALRGRLAALGRQLGDLVSRSKSPHRGG